MQASEPSTSAGVCVDADGMSEIERDVGFLCSVSTNHGFTRLVWEGSAKFLVDDGEWELLVHWDIRF